MARDGHYSVPALCHVQLMGSGSRTADERTAASGEREYGGERLLLSFITLIGQWLGKARASMPCRPPSSVTIVPTGASPTENAATMHSDEADPAALCYPVDAAEYGR
jgi:hypothetical protein